MLQLVMVLLFLQSTFGNLLYEDKEIDALKSSLTNYYEQFGGKLDALIRKNESATQETLEQLQNAAETKLQIAGQTIEKLLQDSPNSKECITESYNQILKYLTEELPKMQKYFEERTLGYEKLRNETEKDFREGVEEIKQALEEMRGCNTIECNNVECVLCDRKKRVYANVKVELNWLYTTEIKITNRANAFIQFVDGKVGDAKKCIEVKVET